MNIRFCEFCSGVNRDGQSHCPECGTRLVQEVTEERFNDQNQPWPFEPVSALCLRIQGQPRKIIFHGTHSVYHCWSRLHESYEAMRLYYRCRKEEMDLLGNPDGACPKGYRLLDPGVLISCNYRKFSFSFYEDVDPDVAMKPGETELIYQGTIEIEDCPEKQWGNVLGWLAATAPRPRPDDEWTYDI